jgi:hypothetical protein
MSQNNFIFGSPAVHVGGIIWLQGWMHGTSIEFRQGLMKIATFECGFNQSTGEPAPSNKCYALDKNFWGMLQPSQRPTTGIGGRATNDGVANVKYNIYPSYWACGKDIYLWLKYNNAPASLYTTNNPTDVIQFCQDKGYNAHMIGAHSSVPTERVDNYLTSGRNRIIVMTIIFTSLTVFLLSRIFKGAKRTKFLRAIGPLKAFASKTTTRARRKTRVAVGRVRRAYRRRYVRKSTTTMRSRKV